MLFIELSNSPIEGFRCFRSFLDKSFFGAPGNLRCAFWAVRGTVRCKGHQFASSLFMLYKCCSFFKISIFAIGSVSITRKVAISRKSRFTLATISVLSNNKLLTLPKLPTMTTFKVYPLWDQGQILGDTVIDAADQSVHCFTH